MDQDLRRSAINVIDGWQKRMTNKPRAESLPVSFTSSALACIQSQACFRSGKEGCAYWIYQLLPCGDLEGHCKPCKTTDIDSEESRALLCKTCQSPGVSRAQLYRALWPDDTKDQDDQERVLRRFSHGGAPMHSEAFLKALANAWALGWLSDTQAVTFLQECMRLNAASSTLTVWLKKLRRRVMPDVKGEGLMGEIEHAEQNHWSVFFCRATHKVDTDHQWEKNEKAGLLAILRE